MNAARITLPTPGTELPHLGGSLGAYVAYPDGTTRALIVASPFNDQTGEWGEYGQDVPGARGIDGLASTNAMAEAGSGLAQAVRALTIGGHTDWYIPSRMELLALYEQAPQLFKDKVWHWSSTQFSRYDAWCQAFEYGGRDVSLKDYRHRARAVRSVQLQHISASPLPSSNVAEGDSREILAAQEGGAA